MKKFFCPINSKIKMVMFFTQSQAGYKGKCEVQYSLLAMNKKSQKAIMQAMEVAFLKKKYKGAVKTAIFYDNITGLELKKVVL